MNSSCEVAFVDNRLQREGNSRNLVHTGSSARNVDWPTSDHRQYLILYPARDSPDSSYQL
jgi:hypothetical protein